MKIRNFYPRQVLRKLQGDHKQLDAGQLAAVKFAVRKGRKFGISLMVGSTATSADVLAATNQASAKAIIANANTRIILKEAA